MYRDEQGWIGVYQQEDAYWAHSGKPLDPHAELTSGNHSNGFFNSRKIIPNPKTMSMSQCLHFERLLKQAASDLVDQFLEVGGDMATVDRVVGPQTGATLLAELISIEISRRRGKWSAWGSPKKETFSGQDFMIFDNPKRSVQVGEHVLMCEDVVTTGGSVKRAIDGVKKHGGEVLPYLLPIVNRSGQTCIEGLTLCGLITRDLPIWKPEECPLCPAGSTAIRPKEHWAELTALS